MDRRQFLKGSGIFAGGLALGAYPGWRFGKATGYNDAKDEAVSGTLLSDDEDESEAPPLNERIHKESDTFQIEEGSYRSIPVEFGERTRVVYSMAADGYLDALFLDRRNFRAYENGGDPSYMTLVSSLDTTEAAHRRKVYGGNYNLIFDNTGEFGSANPDGPVEVSYVLSLNQAN